MTVDRIVNESKTQWYSSGQLHLTLWATETSSPYGTGYTLGQASINRTLFSDSTLYSQSVATDYQPPPANEYYVHMFISASPSLFTIIDYLTFSEKKYLGGTPPAPPPPPPPPPNNPPHALDASAVIFEDGDPVTGGPVGSDDDGDSLTYGVVRAPRHGILTIADDGSWSYALTDSPDIQALSPGATLTDSGTIEVSDGADAARATVTITIEGTNDDPTAEDVEGAVTVGAGSTAIGNVNAADVDSGDTHTFTVTEEPKYGNLTVDETGTWTYVLDQESAEVRAITPNDTLSDSGAITVLDSFGGSAQVSVKITINGQGGSSDDHGNAFRSATLINLGSTVQGNLEIGGDIDVFALVLEQAGVLRLWSGGDTDTFAALYSSNEQTIAVDDDSGEWLNFEIVQHLQPGTYYLEVKGVYRFTTGEYALRSGFTAQRESVDRPRFSNDEHLGDFNGDGYDDILLRHRDGRWWMHISGDGDIERSASGEVVGLPHDTTYHLAGIGDFNADGRSDVLIRQPSGHFELYAMNGKLVLAESSGVTNVGSDLEYIVAGIGDFSGDGFDDVLLRHETAGDWRIFAMKGTEFIESVSGSMFIEDDVNYAVRGIGDFNGDEYDDVLLQHSTFGDWYLVLLQGRRFIRGTGPVWSLPEETSFQSYQVADFDHDGQADILLQDAKGAWHFYFLRFDSEARIMADQVSVRLPIEGNETLVAVGDMNANGYEDLVFRHAETGIWRFVYLEGSQITGNATLSFETDTDWAIPIHGEAPNTLYAGKVRGQLRIAKGQSLDGDTLDLGKAYVDEVVSNNSIRDAQDLLAPASVHGFASLSGDPIDVYSFDFPSPVRINLAIADPQTADLDLYLAKHDGRIIEHSLGSDDFEVIQTALEGTYFVVVTSYTGASNYSLVVELVDVDTSSNGATTWSKNGYFVADELLVVNPPIEELKGFEESEVPADSSTLREVAKVLKLESAPENRQGILRTRPNSIFYEETHVLQSAGLSFDTPEIEAKAATLLLRKHLEAKGFEDQVQLNYIYQHSAIPNDPRYRGQKWHYDEINLERAWDITTGGDIVVAVVDSGVVTEHPDLRDSYLRDEDNEIVGQDLVRDPDMGGDGDGIDSDPSDVSDSGGDIPNSFHGTHVAGTIGAVTNNGVGVAGIMQQGRILPVRVLGVGGVGTTRDIAEGIRYSAGLSNDSASAPEQSADVINLSLGSANELCLPFLRVDRTLLRAVESAIRQGVVVVHAAGNDNCYYTTPISTVEDVISVGATDYFGEKAFYSNYGADIDLVAPGGGAAYGILSTSANDAAGAVYPNYRRLIGTSMAAPHVSGTIGLMLSVNSAITPVDINRLISGTHTDAAASSIVRDIGPAERDDLYGYGMLDAYKAVRVAKSIRGGVDDDAPQGPILRVAPGRLSFGQTTTRLRVRIENTGDGDLQIEAVDSDSDWLSAAVDDQGAHLLVSVDRRNQPEGTLIGQVSLQSSGGSATLHVSAQVRTEVVPSDVGTVIIGLVEPNTFEIQDVIFATAGTGYSFESLSDVPPGQYYIVAGTNRDGDDSICDAGEACGMFPVLSKPQTITVDGDKNIDFAVSIDLFATVFSQSIVLETPSEQGFLIPESLREKFPD